MDRIAQLVLLLGWLLTMAQGFSILHDANSAIHEIEAFLLFIISAMFFIGLLLYTKMSQSEYLAEQSIEAVENANKEMRAVRRLLEHPEPAVKVEPE